MNIRKNQSKAYLSILLLLLPLLASAHDFEVDGVYYNITDSTELTVEVTYEGQLLTDYTNAVNNSSYRGDIVIPTTVTQGETTYRVTSIGGSAFYQAKELTSVTISEGLTSIGLGAFTECNLSTITLPESLVTIGEYAFNTCRDLTSITIPKGVKSIKEAAFAQCQSLISVTIPDNSKLTLIGGHAFYGCRSLTSITIPKSVTSIERRAFAKCSKLSNVYCCPEKVPSTAADVFLESTPKDATLHVPASAWASYKATEPWSGFGNIVAQGSDPIAIDGKKWHTRTQVPYIDDRYTNDVFMWVEGDTIVDGISCKKLYKQTRNVKDSSMGTIEVGYCRQGGDKYYQDGKLMFDFGLGEGDMFATSTENEEAGFFYTVVSIGDTLLLDGLPRKYMVIAPSYEGMTKSSHTDIWIEGIGSLSMGIFENDFYYMAGLKKELQSCSYNGIYIYKKKEESKTYLVTEGKEWAFRSLVAQETRDVVYKLSGDTIINGHKYTKEWQQAGWIDSSKLELTQGFLREENGKVYRKEYNKEEYLWFDYNANIGDTIFYEHSFVKVVGHSDTTITCNGVSRTYKGVDVQVGIYDANIGTPDSFDNYEYYLIPGYIETFYEELGLFANGDIVRSPSFYMTGQIGYLLYVKQDDTMLYQIQSENKIFSQDMKWYGSIIDYYWGRPSIYNNLTYHIGADTITDRGFGQNLYRNDEYWGTLITMGEQVWLYPSEAFYKESWYADETEEPFLLYDFSLQLNDTLYYTFNTLGFSREKPKDDNFEYMVVKNVYHTYGRKIIEFDQGYRWAEGIGCLGASILNLWRPMTTNGDGVMESIDRVEENGQVIYSNGEFVNPDIESWLKAGMTWTENKQYAKDGEIVSRKITISEGDTPGFYNVSSTDSRYKLPFGRLQVTNNKVYGHGLGDVFLLYDFSLKVGDKIYLLKYYCYGLDKCTYEYDQCYVAKVDTAVYNGVPRKRITLSGDREDVWVEGIGSLTRVFPIDGVIDYDFYSENAIFSEVAECSHNGELLYRKNDFEITRPLTQHGYGLYHGMYDNTFLYAYTINEAVGVTDSTDFARWNDREVIRIDVDTIGPNAFSGATFRQGQIICFSDRLNTICKDAFAGINIVKRTSQEAPQISDDLTLVFEGTNPPGIDKNQILDYADSTCRINYAVPDIATYVASDIQWTYTTLMTIEDLLRGQISPENEVTVSDSTEVNVVVGEDALGPTGNGDLVVTVEARPRKDIPIRIGDGENKDIYSRAPAWQRYTMELKVTDSQETVLFEDAQECNAEEGCVFEVALSAYPEDGVVYLHSRSTDMFNRSTEWSTRTASLTGIEQVEVLDQNAPYYDLQGRPVANPTRGIYIRNGRKVVVVR